jgi:N-acetylmuramoyl-L-alanine amidase
MTHVPGAPFSFLNTIYWNQDIPLNDAVGQLILRHEITHVTQGHSYDKLLSQIMACLFWFNPFYWIVQHELAIVHEFIADEAAVSNRDPKVFSLMLLGACSKGRRLVPQHHFFASAVKRRLNMLQANRPGSAIVRCLAALPVLAASVFFCSFGISAPAANALTPASSPIVLLVDAAHGGSDAGASAGGYREKDISLQYALRLKELAAKYNIEVQLTRNDDRSLSLGERVALAGKIHPDLFLSLHVAAETGAGAARRGIEMFVSGENSWAPQSGSYGGAMLGMMARNGFISNQPGRKHEKGCSCGACTGNSPLSAGDVPASVKNGIFVLKNVQAPSVVIELGDINEVQSMARLTDEGQIDQLCNALLQGIVNGASQLRQKATDPLNFMNNKKGAPACDK